MASEAPSTSARQPAPLLIPSEIPATSVSSSPATASSQPALKIVRSPDSVGGIPPRIFIGPMPKNEVPPPLPEAPDKYRALKKRFSSLAHHTHHEDSIHLGDVDDRHAFLYFLKHGGKEEDWSEEAEISVRREIIRKWKESGWATVRAKKKKKGRVSVGQKWVGSTFEVGHISGVSLGGMQATASPEDLSEASSIVSTSTPNTPQTPSYGLPKDIVVESPTSESVDPSGSSFVTAHETMHSQGSGHDLAPRPSLSDTGSLSPALPNPSTGSSVPLLKSTATNGNSRVLSAPNLHEVTDDGDSSVYVECRSETDLSQGNVLKPAGQGIKPAIKKFTGSPSDPRAKGKQKAVTFPSVLEIHEEVEEEDEPPSVREVLTRKGSELDYSSAGATRTSPSDTRPKDPQTIVMRDRMLVRVAHTKQTVNYYDEQYSRHITDLDEERWQEYLVVWRAQRIELYEDYTLPGKEWALKRKNLQHIIPLNGLSKPRLSLFSFTDMSFCLTNAPAHYDDKGKTRFKLLNDEGTDIFVFKHKCRSRATDWVWNLWRETDGEVPESMDIHCPALDMKVRLSIPIIDTNAEEGWKTFTLHHVLELCKQSLSAHKDYEILIKEAIEDGRELGLAWRYEGFLDWIWLQTDTHDVWRDWAVLYGLAIRLPSFLHPRPVLEVRVAEYMSTHVLSVDGAKMYEPPAIEGFLWRIRPSMQTKALTYLTSHDGYMFTIPSSKSFLPQPPPGPEEDIQAAAKNSSPDSELRRGTAQILQADAIIDLRNMALVRRAASATLVTRDPQAAQLAMAAMAKSTASVVQFDRIPTNGSDDDLDSGGEEPLEDSSNAAELRLKRSFELVMRSGYVIRFEAYSCDVAVEWIKKLRQLIKYWARRHRVDARFEMELRNAIAGVPAKNRSVDCLHKAPPLQNPDAASQYLGPFYNWTVLKGLRPIIRCGRAFLKTGIHEPFSLTQLLLVTGHLITFPIQEGNDSRAHRKGKTINLLDTYVCSGRFALKALPASTVRDELVPRRYQDGLECDDKEEDTLVVLWHVHHPIDSSVKDPKSCGLDHNYKQTSLSAKRRVTIIKARSKLERDAWCNALNAEIERLVRRYFNREKSLCEQGGLVEIKSRQIKRISKSPTPPLSPAPTQVSATSSN